MLYLYELFSESSEESILYLEGSMMYSNIVTLLTAIAILYVTIWSYLHYGKLRGRRYTAMAAVSVIVLLPEYVLYMVKAAPAPSSMSSMGATLALVACVFSWVVCDIAGYRRERKRQFS